MRVTAGEVNLSAHLPGPLDEPNESQSDMGGYRVQNRGYSHELPAQGGGYELDVMILPAGATLNAEQEEQFLRLPRHQIVRLGKGQVTAQRETTLAGAPATEFEFTVAGITGVYRYAFVRAGGKSLVRDGEGGRPESQLGRPPDVPQLGPPGWAVDHHASAECVRFTSGASGAAEPFSQNRLAARKRSRQAGAMKAVVFQHRRAELVVVRVGALQEDQPPALVDQFLRPAPGCPADTPVRPRAAVVRSFDRIAKTRRAVSSALPSAGVRGRRSSRRRPCRGHFIASRNSGTNDAACSSSNCRESRRRRWCGRRSAGR